MGDDQLSPGRVREGGDQLSPGRVPMGGDQLSRGTVAGNRTRYITADVRGAVYARDGGRCTYVDPLGGLRCGERRFVELHHTEPYAWGGGHTVEGITLRCRAHNLLDARLAFGDAAIERYLRPGRPVGSEALDGGAPSPPSPEVFVVAATSANVPLPTLRQRRLGKRR